MIELEFKKIASNVPGSEGPCYDNTGRWFCVEPYAGKILQVMKDGTLREHANTGGIPAGLQVDPQGHLWCADMKLGIFRISPDGKLKHVVKEFEGKPIRGCNDCSLDSKGNLYFTAPAGSSDTELVGEVFVRKTDGVVRRIDQGYSFCNGLAINAKEDRLIVAETWTKKLWVFDVSPTTETSNKRLFAQMLGDHRGGPDGIDFDEEGNLLVAHWGSGGLDYYAPDGTLIQHIKTPFLSPSNVHFGGPDGKTLIVTEHTENGVWETRWHCRGLTR
jgi:gluconolactonase